MWALLWKGPERISLGVVVLEDGKLALDVAAAEVKEEIEPLFEVGDITYAYGRYGDNEWEPLKLERMTERWFVAVLNSLPEPYGWSRIER
jgi:hypothetical protein